MQDWQVAFYGGGAAQVVAASAMSHNGVLPRLR